MTESVKAMARNDEAAIQKAEAQVDRAYGLGVEEGRYLEAVELLEPIVHDRSLPAAIRERACVTLAISQFESGQRRNAVRTLNTIVEEVEFRSRRSDLLALRGHYLAEMGRAKKAERSLREALACDSPNESFAYPPLVDLLINQGRFREAELLQHEYLAKAPPENQFEAARTYSLLLTALHRFPEALEWADRAKELATSESKLIVAKVAEADCREQMGQLEVAATLWSEVLATRHRRLRPLHVWRLADVLVRLGRCDEAKKVLTDVTADDVPPRIVNRVREALAEQEGKQKRRSSYRHR